MLQDNLQSSPQSFKLTRKRSTRPRNSPKRLMDQQSNVVSSRLKCKPSSLVTCTNDSTISVLTIDTSVKKCYIESSKPSVVKKKRKNDVLTNISVKKSKKKNQQQMIQVIIICIKPTMWKNNLKKKRLNVRQISYQVRNLPSNVAIHHVTIGYIIYVKINTTMPNMIMDLSSCIVAKNVV